MASQPKYSKAQRIEQQRAAGRIVAAAEKGTAAQKADAKRSADVLVSNSMQSVTVKAHTRAAPNQNDPSVRTPTVRQDLARGRQRASQMNSTISSLGFGNYTPPASHTHSG